MELSAHTPGESSPEDENGAPSAPEAPPTRPRRGRWLKLALAVALTLLLGGFGVDRALHRDRVLRRVQVAGVALGGLDRNAARRALAELEGRLRAAPLLLTIGTKQFELRAEQIDYALAADAILEEALACGRRGSILQQLGWWLARLRGPTELSAHGTLDAAALAELVDGWAALAIDDSPFDGAVVVRGGAPVADPPRTGTWVDGKQAAALVLAAFDTPERAAVALPLTRKNPRLSAEAVSRAAGVARRLVAAPLALVAELPRLDEAAERATARFVLSPEVLAGALRSTVALEPAPAVVLAFDAEAIDAALGPARLQLEHPPVPAAFVIDARDRVRVRPSRPASVIDAKRVAERLFQLASRGEREGAFPIEVGSQPELVTEAARALGIKELLAKFTTHHPCCHPRVQNIHRIADLVDGVLLRPGERFSINDHVGERTVKNGFVPAPTIVEGEMEDTIGGGVSQFATTFFNAAFYGGYEIIERQAHSFYFPRYPMGHEATLSFPKPDVIIRNDSNAGLLIRTFYTATSITVKLYGDNGGRKVTRKVSRPRDLVSPPIEYIADPSLAADDAKVKERGQQGWTVAVARIIAHPDGRSTKEQRNVVYNPRVRRVRVHPCNIPEGKEGYTGEPCPKPEEEESSEDRGPHGEDQAEVEPTGPPDG